MTHFACATRIVRQLNFLILGVIALCTPIWAAPPQFVYENDFLGKWGSTGSGNGQFSQPAGIAQDSEGNVFVVDISNSRVQKFDSEGQFLSTFGSFGAGNGQFFSPHGVAINSSDEIYVVDFSASGNRVQQFDADGVFIRAWGTGGAGAGEFQNPQSLTVAPNGNVYVSDYGNDRIQIFEPDGDFIRAFGTSGSGNGELSFPDGIAVDASGNVYVVDRANNRVQVFDSSDAFVRTWGTVGSGDGQFDGPGGLALGADGIIYVTDFNNDRVQAFTTEGVFLGKWGTAGNGDGEFQGPRGVMVTGTGRVYVANSDMGVGNRVQFFEPIWNVTMDEDGDPTDFALTLNAIDADMDTITWSISGPAMDGTAGATGTGASKAITYAPDANYNGDDSFTVQIDDGNAGTATRTVNVTIAPIADAPIIDQGAGPLQVTMSQDGSPLPFVAPTVSATEPDGDTILWSVSSAASNGTATVSGSGASPSTFTYVPTGGYIGADAFTIQASDGVLSDTIVVEVTVTPAAETPVITQGAGPLAVSMDEEGIFTAPTLSATDADTAAGSLTWSVSSPATSGSADVSGSGASPSTFTYAPATDFAGSDSFTVQVSDGVLTDTIVVNVTVNNINDDPVIFQGDGPLFVIMSEDSSPTDFVRPTLYATDVDGDTLTWSVAAQGADGTATVSGTGSSATVLDFVPNANFNGEDSFYVQVSDGTAPDVIEIKVTINPVNDAPEFTQGAGPITAQYDQGGDNSGFQTPGIGASDLDNDGDDLVWSVLTQAAHGTATVSGSGLQPEVFTYVADPQYLGQDTFEIQVSDGTLTDTISVVVTMNDVNDDPVITQGDGPLALEMDEDGSPRAFVMPALDATDVDGDSLTWSLVAQGADGTATVSGSGASPATMTFVPNENYVGVDQFTVQVADGRGGVDHIIVALTIEAVNDAPTIDQDGPVEATMDEDGSFEAPGLSASDVDGDTLTWSIATQPEHGTAAMSGSGATPEVFSYTPEVDFNGDDSFEVEVSDGTLSDTVTVNVTVNPTNDAPEITSVGTTITMNEDGASPDFSVLEVAAADIDSDIDELSWSVSLQGEKGTAGVSPSGASPLIVYVPALNQNGTDEFTLAVSDGDGGVAEITLTVTITPQPDAPIIAQGDAAAGMFTRQGTGSGFAAPALSATDPDGDALAWSLLTQAAHGVAEVSGSGTSPTTLDYVAEAEYTGADSFVVAVSDGDGGIDTITINVTVIERNDVPVIAEGAGPIVVSMNENGAFLAPGITASDGDGDTLTWTLGSAPSHGTAEVGGEGESPATLSYVPEPNFVGSDRFTVTVSDGNGASDSIEVAITIIEVFDPPVIDQGAGPIAAIMDEDGVPTDFVAPELSASDSDTDAPVLVWSLSSPPAHGAAEVSGSGASPAVLTYVPAANFNGADSFTVSVADAEGGSDTIVVAVTVNPINDLPEIAEAKSFGLADEWEVALPEGLSALTRLPIAIGPEGDVYTGGEAGIQIYNADGVFERNFSTFVADSLAVGNDGAVFAAQTHPPVLKKFSADGEEVSGWPAAADLFRTSVPLTTSSKGFELQATGYVRSITTAPGGGVYLSQSEALTLFEADTEVVFWRQLDAAGDILFTSNGGLLSDTAKYIFGRNVHAVDANHRIYVWEDTFQIYNADRSLARQFAGPSTGTQESRRLAVAPNGESLFLAGENALEVEMRDANGTVQGKIGTGLVSGLAATNARLYVSQHAGPSVRIYEEGDEADLVRASILEDQRFVYRTSVVDIDGQSLAWSVSEAPANGTAAAITVGAGQVEITFTPVANFFGDDSFSVEVSDGTGGTDTLRFVLEILPVNDAPLIEQGAGPFDVAMDEDGDPVGFLAPELTALDIEGSAITWSVASNPSRGAAVVTGEGESPEVFTYTPSLDANGVDQFTVSATDAEGGVANVVIRVTVRPVSDPPRFSENEEYRYMGRWDIPLPTGGTVLTRLPIAVAPDGNVYTGGANGIQIFDSEGEFVRQFSTFVADYLGVDVAGNVYVGVESPPSIRKFDADGVADATWPAAQDLFGTGGGPRLYSLAVAPSGEVRLTRQVGDTVSLQNLDVAGAETSSENLPLTRVGSDRPGNIITGSGREISYIVATDDAATAYVRQQFVRSTYTSRYRYDSRWEVVRRYDSAGTYMGEFALYGMNQGARRTMAVRPDGERTFVSDSSRFFAEAHNRAGRVVSQFGGLGTGDGRFRAMSGMAANADGRIYVSDHLNRRIQYFDRIPDSNLIVVFLNEDWDFDLPVDVVDPDGDPLTWTIDRAPEHGTATGGASLNYEADENFEGEDSLVLTVGDGTGNESTREIRIIINPLQDRPVIDQGDAPITVVTDKNKPFNQAAITATDPDSADVLTWTVIAGPSNGVIQRTGTDTTSFAFTYTPARDYIGRDSIRLRVSDGQGGEDTIEIAITVRDVLDGGTVGGTPAQNAARIQANFALVDLNQDDKVSLAEVQSVYPEVTDAQFAELDLNHDGFLTEEELANVEAPPTGCNNPGSEKAFSDTLIGRIVAMLTEGLLGLL